MQNPRVQIQEIQIGDLPFLIALWNEPNVMRYADEFPGLRGWSRTDDVEAAWQAYQAKRAELGEVYVQLILRLADGTPIGESFFAPLQEGATWGAWRKPEGELCLLGDVKLLAAYWGQGLGSEGMGQIVRHLFGVTVCERLVVPPHRHNPAAQRVYEKVGFVRFTGMRSHRNHKIFELTRARFEEVSR